MKRHKLLLVELLILIMLILPNLDQATVPVLASETEEVDKAVVKIISRTNGAGTGVVVNISSDTASIVTAAHVVENDDVVQVSISPRADLSYQARVSNRDSPRNYNGLALVVLRGEVVRRLRTLEFDTVDPRKGDPVFTVGFPDSTGPWNHMPGRVVAMNGLTIDLSNHVEEGNSGGPVINERSGKAVGLVMREQRGLGHALPASTVRATLAGWGVRGRPAQYAYAFSGTIQYKPCGSNTLQTHQVNIETSKNALHQVDGLYGHYASVSLTATQYTNKRFCASGMMGNSPHQHMHPPGLEDNSTNQQEHTALFAVVSQGTPGRYFKGGWQGNPASGCMYMEIFFEPTTACDNQW